MAEEIVIKTVLDLSGSEQRLKQQIEKALGSPEAQAAAKNAGRKLGESLGLGIETARRGREDKELAHMRRLEAINLQSANRIQEIERRKQSQLDLIRERAVQKELEHARKIERETQRGINSLSSFRSAVAGIQGLFAGLAAGGVVSFFENLARRAIDAAVAIDRQVNTLRALTGSAEAAQKRFAELFALAQRTPGLTTSLALTLDTQLRILNVTEQTINRLLPAIGRLNAIAPLGDPARFAGNLTQLITQGFERQDLKELVGNSPFAGELIKQIFDVNSPTNAKAIREAAQKLGINTVEEFFTAFAKAAENNPRLQAVQESLGTQFEKLQDRITVALAPIGDELLKTIIPAFKDLVELLERDAPKINALLRDNRNEILLVANAFVTLASEVGRLIGLFRDLDQQFGIIRSLSVLALALTPQGVGGVIPLIGALDRAGGRTDPRLFSGPEDAEAGGITGTGLGSQQFRTFDDFMANRAIGAGRSATLGGGTGARARRSRTLAGGFGSDFGLNEAALLEREAELARIRQSNEAVVRRRALAEQAEERPGQLAGFNARLAERIRLTELETLRLEENTKAQAAAELQRTSRRDLSRSGRSIDDLVSRGAVTPGEAERLGQAANREFAQRQREILALEQQRGELTQARKDDLEDEIALYDRLGTAISDSERFMRGFNSQVGTVGDAFERFGQNVSRAFGNVRDLFNGLKSAVLGFFNDLLGQSLQNLVRQTLGGLFGGGGGGAGGGIGGLFRTPGTFPAQIAQAFAGAAGGGISVPGSISSGATGIFANGAFARGLSGASGGGGGLGGVLGRIFGGGGGSAGSAGGGFSLGGLLGGLAGAAPLLGLSLGSGLGGTSTAGNILGAIGGGAVGLGLSFGASVFSAAGGGLGALGPAALAALGPIALVGAPLLVGAILLGKASQRKKDEEASGQFLTQALQGIEQLAAAVGSGQITSLGEAKAIFDRDILGTFRQQISGLKTASVRESRLKNQVADLRNVFEARIPPLIAEQERRASDARRFAAIDSRLIPQFAGGGTVPGIDRGFDSVIARVRPGEKILTMAQQSSVIAQAGPGVFDRAGVPRTAMQVGGAQAFQIGGTAQPIPSSRAQGGGTVVIDTLFVSVDAEGITFEGLRGRNGENIIVNRVQRARKRNRSV